MVRSTFRMAVAAMVVLLVGLAPAIVAADQRTAGKREDVARSVVVERVRMVDNVFRPRSLTVAAGTRVRWVNRGIAVHSTTSNSGIWDSGLLDPGEAYGRVFRKAGTFKYHCSVHPTVMKGVITVT